MTIAPLELDDADLAVSAARGDQGAFAEIYDRYADRLYDFCTGMLRDRDAAADCVQDVFVTAATKLGQLEDPSRLRGWLYAIARHEALARIRARKREMPSEELPEAAGADPDHATVAARHELADLIDEAFGGLADRDRVVYELAYRHGLDGLELAGALGVSHTNANTMVGRLRVAIERSLGALLMSRSVRGNRDGCAELVALLADWDGVFTPLIRKRVARHIDECAVCDGERRRRVSPAALLGSAPVFVPAPGWLRDCTLSVARDATPAVGRGSAQKRTARAGLGAALVLIGIGGALQLGMPVMQESHPVSEPVGKTVSRRVGTPAPSSASGSSVGGSVTARQIPTVEVTTTVGVPATTTVAPTTEAIGTPTLTSTPEDTTAPNSFEPNRPSNTRTRTTEPSETRTTEPVDTGTMTATYLPGTPVPTVPPGDPIE